MQVGKIVDTPNVYSAYARVRDEHGGEHTVHGSEVDIEAEDGDEFAYQVDIWQNTHGNVSTLRSGVYGPED
ncbi:MAG: hypothetical protein AB8G05_22385 [Oligoflexales bacterium]